MLHLILARVFNLGSTSSRLGRSLQSWTVCNEKTTGHRSNQPLTTHLLTESPNELTFSQKPPNRPGTPTHKNDQNSPDVHKIFCPGDFSPCPFIEVTVNAYVVSSCLNKLCQFHKRCKICTFLSGTDIKFQLWWDADCRWEKWRSERPVVERGIVLVALRQMSSQGPWQSWRLWQSWARWRPWQSLPGRSSLGSRQEVVGNKPTEEARSALLSWSWQKEKLLWSSAQCCQATQTLTADHIAPPQTDNANVCTLPKQDVRRRYSQCLLPNKSTGQFDHV